MSFRGSMGGSDPPNDWSRISQTVTTNVQKISQNVNQMQRMVNQLGTTQDSETLRSQLHEVQHYTNQLARDTNNSIKELAQLPNSTNDSEQKQISMKLINDFSKTFNNFLSLQRIAVQKEKESVLRPRLNFGLNSSSSLSRPSTLTGLPRSILSFNSTRASRLAGTTPYSFSQRYHLAPVLKVDPKVKTSKPAVNPNDLLLSSSSRRILEKLEKASTPLQDARRVPYSQCTQFKDYFNSSNLLVRSAKRPKFGPPTASTPILGQTTINHKFQPLKWELKPIVNKVSSTETTDQLIKSCDNRYSLRDPNINDTKDMINIKDIKTNETFGGKMFRKDTKREERRAKAQTVSDETNDEELNLLRNVEPLSIPSGVSLPKFNFGNSSSFEKQSNSSKTLPTTTLTKVDSAEDEDPVFKFAEPVLRKREKNVVINESVTDTTNKPFVFSSPSGAITQKPSIGLKTIEKEANILKKSLQKDTETIKTGTTGDSTLLVKNNEIESKKTNEISNEKWICVCLYQNNCSQSRCKACNKERESNVKQSAPSFKGQTSLLLNSIENKSPKAPLAQTDWGDKFKAPVGSWICSECFVNNSADKTKCMACEVPKPGVKNTITSKETPKSTTDLWKCFYCKESNEMSKSVCKTCDKIKTPMATKEDLDKLYGEQSFKFGITEDKTVKKDVIESIKPIEVKKDLENKSIFKSTSTTPQTSTTNAFTFGSTSTEKPKFSIEPNVTTNAPKVESSFGWGDKFKAPSDSWTCPVCLVPNTADKTKCMACEEPKPGGVTANNVTTSASAGTGTESLFKFGFQTKPTTDIKPIEKSSTGTTDISDLFGSNKSKLSSPLFQFGAQPSTTSTTSANPKPTVTAEPSQLFVFGSQSKSQSHDLLVTKKSVSFELENKSETNSKTSEKITNVLSKDSTTTGFQFAKPAAEEKPQLFKGFSPSSSGSLFGSPASAANTTVTTVTTDSINSFLDNKSNTSGSLFGRPVTTTTSSSFSSPFSTTNKFNLGLNSNITTAQTTGAESGVNNIFSLGTSSSSSSLKSFDSIVSNNLNQTQSLANSMATPTAPLNSTTSSSQQKNSVFGNPNTNLQTFSSQPSTLNSKSNFSFNMNANTVGANTSKPDNAFDSNKSLFGSNASKGFTFGNSSLNNTQSSGFSFNIPSTNTISNTSTNLSFGLNTNNNTIDTKTNEATNSKPASNSMFTFGQTSDQFSNSLTQKPLNSNPNKLNTNQFSFGITSNPTNGQTNSTNLFGNAINAGATGLSFNQSSTGLPTVGQTPFTFGGFGSNQSTPSVPQIQSQPPQQTQQSLPPPQFNFSQQPSFEFGSMPNAGAQPGAPVFQFSAEPSQAATQLNNRNIKKSKKTSKPYLTLV